MERTDWIRVLQGGIFAGLLITISEYVLNQIVLREQIAHVLILRNLPPISSQAIAAFVVLAFLLGLVTVWLYAVLRLRFGAGAKSWIISASVVWFLAYFWSSAFYCVLGLFPPQVFLLSLAWGFLELVLSATVGGKIYSREKP